MSQRSPATVKSISRQELYDMVWARPAIMIAAEFGISSTALKKICARNGVPTPERGYWARGKRGTPAKMLPLPNTQDGRSRLIKIQASPQHRLRQALKTARDEAKADGDDAADPVRDSTPNKVYLEPSVLAPTRKALLKARPDKQGFIGIRGPSLLRVSAGTGSIERVLGIVGRLALLAEKNGYRVEGADGGLAMVIQDEPIVFAIEEMPDMANPLASGKPSGRLALRIDANEYQGLRRKFSDRKSKALEECLPELLIGFAEHAALAAERRRADEQRRREWQEAETRRNRHAAYEAREKHRNEFVDAISAQLERRRRLVAVLTHIESFDVVKRDKLGMIAKWIRRHLLQTETMLGADALAVSADFAKVRFGEPLPSAAEGGYEYHPAVELRLWEFDYEKELARSLSELEWAEINGLLL